MALLSLPFDRLRTNSSAVLVGFLKISIIVCASPTNSLTTSPLKIIFDVLCIQLVGKIVTRSCSPTRLAAVLLDCRSGQGV